MPPTPSVVTGANVRAEMARRGLTQTVVAEHLGMSQSGVSKRLRGEVAFDVNELTRVAALLDVPLDRLYAQPAEASA